MDKYQAFFSERELLRPAYPEVVKAIMRMVSNETLSHHTRLKAAEDLFKAGYGDLPLVGLDHSLWLSECEHIPGASNGYGHELVLNTARTYLQDITTNEAYTVPSGDELFHKEPLSASEKRSLTQRQQRLREENWDKAAEKLNETVNLKAARLLLKYPGKDSE